MNEEIKGEVDRHQENTLVVNYGNLAKSYLLLNFSDKIAVFTAKGMNDNSDFLNYARCITFETEQQADDFCKEFEEKFDEDYGRFWVKIANGKITGEW